MKIHYLDLVYLLCFIGTLFQLKYLQLAAVISPHCKSNHTSDTCCFNEFIYKYLHIYILNTTNAQNHRFAPKSTTVEWNIWKWFHPPNPHIHIHLYKLITFRRTFTLDNRPAQNTIFCAPLVWGSGRLRMSEYVNICVEMYI